MTSVTLYSVPAVSPVISTDVSSLAAVSVFTLPPSTSVTLYPVNISESGAVHVMVMESTVLVSTKSRVGGLGTMEDAL